MLVHCEIAGHGLDKDWGPLTKRIHLAGDGLSNDSSSCVMSRGRARRFEFAGARQLADLIGGLRPDQAIALGALRPTWRTMSRL
jgi:hypothetical protein